MSWVLGGYDQRMNSSDKTAIQQVGNTLDAFKKETHERLDEIRKNVDSVEGRVSDFRDHFDRKTTGRENVVATRFQLAVAALLTVAASVGLPVLLN